MVAATAELPLGTWSTGEDTGQLVTLELPATVAMSNSEEPSLDTVSILMLMVVMVLVPSTPHNLLIIRFGWQYSCH